MSNLMAIALCSLSFIAGCLAGFGLRRDLGKEPMVPIPPELMPRDLHRYPPLSLSRAEPPATRSPYAPKQTTRQQFERASRLPPMDWGNPLKGTEQ